MGPNNKSFLKFVL